MTGRHAARPLTDSQARARQRALKIAVALHRLNVTRTQLDNYPVDPASRHGSRVLIDRAHRDSLRRILRGLLADQLEQGAQWPAVSGS